VKTLLAGFAAAVVALSCGAAGGDHPPRPGGSITVFAAASLTDAFKKLGDSFQKANAGTTIRFNFAGTPTLVTQIEQGAQADVFASADRANMDRLVADGFTTSAAPQVVAHNKLEIVVAPNNPKHVTSLGDLAKPGVIYISAGPTVPAGKYAAQALAKAGVKVTPKSLETDVRSVVSKVELGEADAGIVYATDVKAAGVMVSGVEIPEAYNVEATYPIAAVKDTRNPGTAYAFIEFVTSPDGQAILGLYGFAPAA
jgi:molybdate transport system substrate-binding protein